MIALRHVGLRIATPVLAAILAFVGWSQATQAGSLQTVRDRGHVVCGVSDKMTGLSAVDQHGRWSGLEVEFCGAVAAAVFGQRDKVKFRAVSATEGVRALGDGEIDVLLGGTAATLSREAELGMRPAGVLFYDGQGFLVPRAFGVSSLLEVSGASICVQQGTGAEKAVAAYFDAKQMRYHLVLGTEWADTVEAYKSGKCTLLTGDVAALAKVRAGLAKPGDHLILPELISQEQTGPFVRQGDEAWMTVVRWTLFAMIEAEQLGLTSKSVETLPEALDPATSRFLGKDGELGASLGLPADWTERIIASVGNYGEVFDRTLGEGSRLKLPRGANDLWNRGGLMTSPSFR